jgi:hypothetical protein
MCTSTMAATMTFVPPSMRISERLGQTSSVTLQQIKLTGCMYKGNNGGDDTGGEDDDKSAS